MVTSARKPTPQQEAIWEAILKGNTHMLCEAVAGAGKTSTSVAAAEMAARHNPALRVGFCAFNKHIAVELQGRLNGSASASTIHSLGQQAILSRVPGARMEPRKIELLAARLWPSWTWVGRDGETRLSDEGRAVCELARKCKVTWVDPAEGEFVARKVCNFFGLDTARLLWKELAEKASELMKACEEDVTSFDFDDMLWLPLRKGWPAGDFDLLFIDECQDLGRAQVLLARSACPSGRIVAVGDRYQSINAFAGADPESVQRLEKELAEQPRGLQPFPLTVSFRCPRRHVALARRLVPHIDPASWAEAGDVDEAEHETALRRLKPGDLALCRTNAPLIEAAFDLIQEGRPALVKGREIGKGLIALVNRFKANSIKDLVRKITAWQEQETDRLRQRGGTAQAIQNVEDRGACLGQLAAACETVGELRGAIDNLFADENPENRIVLSSVHRAKGLEADDVTILCPEKLPLTRRDQQPWEEKAELNVLYVAVTRGKQSLTFAGETPAQLRR